MKLQKFLIWCKLWKSSRNTKYIFFIVAVEMFFFVSLEPVITALRVGGNIHFDVAEFIIAAVTLALTAYFFLRSQDNQIYVVARPTGKSFQMGELLAQKFEVEIKSQREQTYLTEISVGDWLNGFSPVKIGFDSELVGQISVKQNILITSLGPSQKFVLFMFYPEQLPNHFLKFSFLNGTSVEAFVKCCSDSYGNGNLQRCQIIAQRKMKGIDDTR